LKNGKPIPYGRQHITQEDVEAVTAVLQSDILTQGPTIEEFEKKFASYIGSTYAVAVSNGTAALHLCALALHVNSSSKVITTSITFAASANCIRYCEGSVDFVDIDSNTYLLDIEKVEKQIQSKPAGYYSGIVAVDFAGHPVNLESFRNLANKYHLWIIEDACHAPGGYFTDSKNVRQNCGNGNYADLAIFSFHPVKHIATGEGGMVTTNDKSLYDKLILLRTHGITRKPELLMENHGGWYYEMQELGYNYRITDFQAALGISQLKRADEGLKRRRSIAKKYTESFAQIQSIITPAVEEGHAYHLYVIQVEDRLDLYNYLKTKNIYSQVHYIPVHLMPYYKQLGWSKGDLPVAESYYEKCLSLPMYPTLADEELNYVIDCISQYYSHKK
jgi:UDP-4-amino-4,6-dideoxy-N-acetyl-beta-L-altrosamine transaminase